MVTVDTFQYQDPNQEEEQTLSQTGHQDQGGIQEDLSRHGLKLLFFVVVLKY